MTTIGPTVDVPQAADLMKVHPKTVQDYIKSGELAAGKVGRAYVMLTKDVLALVERQIIEQTAARLGTPQRHQRRSARSLPRRLA
jgi:excisionase family DNA binding protein